MDGLFSFLHSLNIHCLGQVPFGTELWLTKAKCSFDLFQAIKTCSSLDQMRLIVALLCIKNWLNVNALQKPQTNMYTTASVRRKSGSHVFWQEGLKQISISRSTVSNDCKMHPQRSWDSNETQLSESDRQDHSTEEWVGNCCLFLYFLLSSIVKGKVHPNCIFSWFNDLGLDKIWIS